MRQLKSELYLIEEATGRFRRIISVFEKRATLTPEQKVSLTVFRYALEEETQKKARSLAESASREAELSIALGRPIKLSEAIYPKLPRRWPAFPGGHEEKSSALALATARKAAASSEMALARAEAWPTLSIGPNYERLPMRDGLEERIGLGLAFDLPILNRNAGGKALASLQEEKGRLEAAQAAYSAQERRAALARQYRLLTEALASSPSPEELEKGHDEFEREFNRGLVSYSMMIEAHRQLHDTVEAKHRQELTALELLWRAQQLSGELSPEAM